VSDGFFDGFEEKDEQEGYSFESILADVKSSAFINGDKKTPPDLLQEKADRILREAAEMSAATAAQKPPELAVMPGTISTATRMTTLNNEPEIEPFSLPDDDYIIPKPERPPNQRQAIYPGQEPDYPEQQTQQFVQPQSQSGQQPLTREEQLQLAQQAYQAQQAYRANQSQDEFSNDFGDDFEPDFSDTDDIPMIVTALDGETLPPAGESRFVDFGSAIDGAQTQVPQPQSDYGDTRHIPNPQNATPFYDQFSDDSYADQNQNTIVHRPENEQLIDEKPSLMSRFGLGKRNTGTYADSTPGLYEDEYSEYAVFEDEVFAEPQLKTAVRTFAASCNSISIRVMPASVITLLMILITYVYEAGMIVPFGIRYSLPHAAGTLTILLLIVMMLCSDIIVRGVDFLIKGVPNAETLILFSCLFSLLSSAFTMISGAAMMLPFCAVSALSLTFAAHGEKYNLRAITETLKTAIGSSEPYGVQAEYNNEIDKSVLKKSFNRTDGFYNNLMQPDITEIVYRFAAPVLLVLALVLTILVVIVRGGVENSLHILSALLAAAAPFSILLSFAVPFATVVKSTRKSGAAVAGWGGADDICFTDGVCVTDDDLFPPGMLKLSGVKVYDGASPENAIRFTASLILSSGSGLTNLFAEVLKQQGLSAMKVDNFECHESGISAVIQKEHVSTGSAAFMNLLGVRVPDDTNMKNAVYTAVNNRLVAMFAIDYKPLPSVQSALISMLKWRIDLYFAMRDFNVTPAMVGQKFKVPFESFVFIPAKDSYSLSDLYSDKNGRMVAVLVREGLNPYAEAITGGRLLKSAAFFATILSVVSAALGVLIMFYMCWMGSFISASPGNLVIFMLCMLTTVLIVCGYVRLKK